MRYHSVMPIVHHNPSELFPSLTVICCRLLDPRWKLEIEAMAAA